MAFTPPPDTYRPLTIASGIRASAARTPDKVAVIFGAQQRSFAALDKRINRIAHAATGLGLARGDNVLLIAQNCIEYFEVVAGFASAGVAVATINPRQTVEEIAAIAEDCGARAVIVDSAFDELVRSASLPAVERIITVGDDLEDLIANASDRPPDIPVQEWDNFAIPYTSGTTGKPKGVVLSHRSRVMGFYGHAAGYGIYSPDDRYLAVAPLFHGAGFSFAMNALFFGGQCELMTGFEPEQVLRGLHERRHTGMFAVPTHFHSMFDLEPKLLAARRDVALKGIICNAAPLPQATKERVVDYFGDGILHETYGSTEAGVVTNLRPVDQLRKQRCVGLPFVATHVRLLGEDGAPVAVGEVGELFSNSPTLFNGYWNKPAETEAAMRDGWFSAGDMARMDDEGYLYIVDRKKDMIISGGVNIYPREIEEVLHRHAAVTDVAVVGMPDDYWGEAVKAFVVAESGRQVSDDDIIGYCRAHVAGHKVPKSIEFIDALPRNPAGKILKNVLRDRPSTGDAPSRSAEA